ncbi:MAG: hypothetical protein V4642_00450 [Bacteroidota bacterium]
MKLEAINTELLNLVKQLGYTVRREQGSFKSNACILKEQKLILLNKSTTLETGNSILAQCLSQHQEILEGQFLKPAIREIIEREALKKSVA